MKSLTGKLEHLPIVDVIQLLHSSRKSGILRFESRKGESQLVFKDGYIVSANHLNSSVRIGKILVDLGIISSETLSLALQAQLRAGKDRKPLIVTLIEMEAVKEEDAYKGLEHLIELTVVEILTWKKGTFTLDVRPTEVSDKYRFYPERISREISVDTQGILMESLRNFDEKMRDGELAEEVFTEEEEEGPAILLDQPEDPGVAELDNLTGNIRALFSEHEEDNPDPSAGQGQKQGQIAQSLSMRELEQLADFLGGFSSERETEVESPRSVLFFSADPLIGHAVTTVCKPAGIPVTVVYEEQELDPFLVNALAGNEVPILVIDAPRPDDERYSSGEISSLRQRKRLHYPDICIIQLVAPGDDQYALQSYHDGVRAVFPRPSLHERRESYVEDTIRFLAVFRDYLKTAAFERESFAAAGIKAAVTRLRDLHDAASAARCLLGCVARVCGRAITLTVRGKELVADMVMGISGGREVEAEPTPEVRISLAAPSLLRDVAEWGFVYCGPADDETVRKHIFAAAGPPAHPTMLLLPIRRHGMTLAVIYGDFGDGEPVPLDIGLLKILAAQAELVLENAFYGEKLAKTVRKD